MDESAVTLARADRRYSPGEEIANTATHGLGLLLSMAGTTYLVAAAVGLLAKTTSLVFGVTLIATYAASTLYHGVPAPAAKQVLRILDHASIYLLIAGTYTPLALVGIRGGWGLALVVVVWSLAAVGVVAAVISLRRFKVLSMVLYLGMGWLAVAVGRHLLIALDGAELSLLIAGGLAYTGGLAFYGWRRLRFGHALWHGCVLAGSVLHFLVVLRVVGA